MKKNYQQPTLNSIDLHLCSPLLQASVSLHDDITANGNESLSRRRPGWEEDEYDDDDEEEDF